ncbi:hypothetical protein GCK72_005611 [Caenorhabditis remanei]|uniref:Uncharacterized protein n=1 Tax=Caenorhabditis remanei TaxID=31234 RepID=A0A6A5HD22_CAERE|nr:hypothetical protein GCK72_005611 [Caenorhabditis remanei]KAF1765658.1 hypothetical protein GCK72_005611 [Caenorhabditis remanei]
MQCMSNTPMNQRHQISPTRESEESYIYVDLKASSCGLNVADSGSKMKAVGKEEGEREEDVCVVFKIVGKKLRRNRQRQEKKEEKRKLNGQ